MKVSDSREQGEKYKTHHLDLPNGRLSYFDEGVGNAIVFLLKAESDRTISHSYLLDQLVPHYRCILVHPSGAELIPSLVNSQSSDQQLTDRLQNLIERLDLTNITLVVTEWGGMNNLAFTLRDNTRIKHLLIINQWRQSLSGCFGGFNQSNHIVSCEQLPNSRQSWIGKHYFFSKESEQEGRKRSNRYFYLTRLLPDIET